jgi:hypothetical protein
MLKVTQEEMDESLFFNAGTLMLCTSCEDKGFTPMECDAYNYECPCCDEKTWSSAEELLMRGMIEIVLD